MGWGGGCGVAQSCHPGYMMEPSLDQEMVPELVVPDLSDTELKPYVSYKTKDIYQEQLTAKYLSSSSS